MWVWVTHNSWVSVGLDPLFPTILIIILIIFWGFLKVKIKFVV